MTAAIQLMEELSPHTVCAFQPPINSFHTSMIVSSVFILSYNYLQTYKCKTILQGTWNYLAVLWPLHKTYDGLQSNHHLRIQCSIKYINKWIIPPLRIPSTREGRHHLKFNNSMSCSHVGSCYRNLSKDRVKVLKRQN